MRARIHPMPPSRGNYPEAARLQSRRCRSVPLIVRPSLLASTLLDNARVAFRQLALARRVRIRFSSCQWSITRCAWGRPVFWNSMHCTELRASGTDVRMRPAMFCVAHSAWFPGAIACPVICTTMAPHTLRRCCNSSPSCGHAWARWPVCPHSVQRGRLCSRPC